MTNRTTPSVPVHASFRGRFLPALLLLLAGSSAHCRKEESAAPAGEDVAAAPAAADAAAAPDGTVADVPEAPSAALVGRVAEVHAPSGASLALVRAGERRDVAAGSDPVEVMSGDEVVTDRRTVAAIALEGGSRLTLDRDTAMTFGPAGERRLRVARGGILAEVVPAGEGEAPLRLDLPTGTLTVRGTKFGATVDESAARIDVSRGEVEVAGRTGDPVTVRAGQEVVLRLEGPPAVTAVRDLAAAMALADAFDPEEKSPRGLGSLTAHPPGLPDQDRPLVLESHKVTVRIQGMFARTEIEEVFRNDGENELEGVYQFPLPSGASISRLALEVEGNLMEGAFVESERAQRIWRGVIANATNTLDSSTDHIWVPGYWRDPALLQWQQGNRFELRIFPIGAKSARRVILAYTEVLRPAGERRRYVYPLPFDEGGSTKAGSFAFEAKLAGIAPGSDVRSLGYETAKSQDGDARVVRFEATDFSPTGDLVLDVALPAAGPGMTTVAYLPEPPAEAAAGGDVAAAYALLAIRPDLPVQGDPVPRDLLFVLDGSYSAFGERWTRQAGIVRSMVEEMDPGDRFAVLVCDVRCRAVGEAFVEASAERAKEIGDALAAIEPGDATDLERTFREAARAFRGRDASGEGRDARLVYVGDGTASAGELDAGRIVEAAAAALDGLGVRVTTVAPSAEVDEPVLVELARRNGGGHVAFAPGRSVRGTALAALTVQYGAALEDPSLALPDGFEAVEPARLPAVRAGDEVLVLARVRADVSGEAVLRGKLGGGDYEQRYPLEIRATSAAGNAFVPRLWAEARIAGLTLRDAAANGREIAALSKEHGVLSRFTALLVLESEAMFRAFEVDRPVRTDDWTGEETVESGTVDGAVDHGVRSVEGARRGGAADLVGRSSRSPELRLGDATTFGGLSREVVHRIVMQHRGRMRHCYETRLRANPELRGRVTIKFVIAPQGTVPSVQVAGNTTGDDGLAACAQDVVRRMSFPQADGVTAVTYPFTFQTDGDGTPLPPDPRPARREPTRQRTAELGVDGAPQASELRKVEEAEAALAEAPDSRDRHRALFLALSRVGELDRALAAAEQWWARDRLDPEALQRMADVELARGNVDRALRLFGSTADLGARDTAVQRRLAGAYESAGFPVRACAHRRALASLAPDDAEAKAAAEACAAGLTPDAAVDTFSAEPGAGPQRFGGELEVEGRWTPEANLDLMVVHPDGRRSSWMQAVRGVEARGAGRATGEELASKALRPGLSRIEVVRGHGCPADVEVAGTVRVVATFREQTFRFVLPAGRSRVQVTAVRVSDSPLLWGRR
jgi:TonB family protein